MDHTSKLAFRVTRCRDWGQFLIDRRETLKKKRREILPLLVGLTRERERERRQGNPGPCPFLPVEPLGKLFRVVLILVRREPKHWPPATLWEEQVMAR